MPGTLHDCAVANIVWSSVYAYDSSKVRNWNAPKTMADFFDTKAYPGKRGMRKSPKVTMEFALIADGGNSLNYIQAEMSGVGAYGSKPLLLETFHQDFKGGELESVNHDAQIGQLKIALTMAAPACSSGLCSVQIQPSFSEGENTKVVFTPLGPSEVTVSGAWRWSTEPFTFSEDGRVLSGTEELENSRTIAFSEFPRGVYPFQTLLAVDAQ